MPPHSGTDHCQRSLLSMTFFSSFYQSSVFLVTCGCVLVSGCGGGSTGSLVTQPSVGPLFATTAIKADGSPTSVMLERAQAISQTSNRTPTPVELLDWAEQTFPDLLPDHAPNQTWGPYIYRVYPKTDLALGVDTSRNAVLAVIQLSTATPQNVDLKLITDYSCLVFPSDCHSQIGSEPLAKRAAALATVLGKPQRLLIGLGTTDVADINAQSIKIDIKDHYLNNFNTYGHYSWDLWGAGGGSYIAEAAHNSVAVGAVPMYTLYQMATWGDGNIWGILDNDFMVGYWNNVRLMYQQIKSYGKPVLVNFEPDFWGYAQEDRTRSGTKDATLQRAMVKSVNADCGNLTDTVASMGQCLVQMARTYAPNAYVGFSPTMWPGITTDNEIAFMKQVGADKADFVVMQTLDRDAGCFEASYTGENALCTRVSATPYWWDMTNQTTPNFTSHFVTARRFHESLGLPLIWWQTPQGVPSGTPGGVKGAFRDNRTQYFLTRAQELVAAGGMAAVFSPGHPTQTTIKTDGGQFKRLSTQYLAAPAALP